MLGQLENQFRIPAWPLFARSREPARPAVAPRFAIWLPQLVALAALFAGCSQPSPPSPQDSQDRLVSASVGPFNESLTAAQGKKEPWSEDPVSIALRFADVDFRLPESLEFSQSRVTIQPEGVSLKVTVETTGLRDDSIEGQKVTVVLRRSGGGAWSVISASRGQRCWPGRGHTNYSAEPCQ
jgi:hypothetical protein